MAIQACAKAQSVLAFLEVDFTTEGEQLNRGRGLSQGACEGTPTLDVERAVFRFERKVAIHVAPVRPGQHIDGSKRRRYGLDIPGVAGEVIFAFIAKVAGIFYLAAIRIHGN